ncbi:glycerol-3-phosphate dehydrogenase/oxidase [Zooshikella ganghwensis]|uniref:glycerol-3-phosphate dehydrogenase/oxidase n=1 Tax=Zooshikella ganghwensis TaxID=202772 RepID=UPI0003FEC51B|nr:glycerol-3-phosphate dehydrogenase/oxidase [Zooshikella ganghwensis]
MLSPDYLKKLSTPSWDVIVVGGGITGAGILRAAAQQGLRCLLIEQRDFAWGTSSRSSSMVHGGLRYLGSGDWKLARDSINEREWLQQSLPGLVNFIPFLMLHKPWQWPTHHAFQLLLTCYDRLAGYRTRQWFNKLKIRQLLPCVSSACVSGSGFQDALTDDARLVMRVLQEAKNDGAELLSYTRVDELVYRDNQVVGVKVCTEANKQAVLEATVVVNATGVWSNKLASLAPGLTLRPLRGSHLTFPAWRLPVPAVVSFFHPQDHRPVFIYPWNNATIVGTTDLDESQKLDKEPKISLTEIDYLLSAANSQFPHAKLTASDVLSCWSGVRPVLSQKRQRKPSKESRHHMIWQEPGLISVSGGKLTTFHLIAEEVMTLVAQYCPDAQPVSIHTSPWLRTPSISNQWLRYLNPQQLQRLFGYYGKAANELLTCAKKEELNTIGASHTLWAELKWILMHEWVIHLDDLLLRRTRLGLLLRNGGDEYFPQIKYYCQQLLSWDDLRWRQEVQRYQQIWLRAYQLPNVS